MEGTRLDNPRPRAGTLTQRHGGLIRRAVQRVESVWPRPWGAEGGFGSGPRARPDSQARSQLIEPTAVPNIPTLASGLPQKLRQLGDIGRNRRAPRSQGWSETR